MFNFNIRSAAILCNSGLVVVRFHDGQSVVKVLWSSDLYVRRHPAADSPM